MTSECTCRPSDVLLCRWCQAIEAAREDEYRSDREEAELDRTVRYHHPENYRGIPREYL